ncbi:guanine deaminase [Labrys sp. WJW]|uniref:guanine deaminase n=1 Tax=Labrys sp. WJW TaxID=1737983 RepID=UPI00082986F4|nr:guanine deaminase [Labrys sp. WJW]OCC06178.1 guanine deaminase [Labrys sp. WJW]
MTTKDLSRADKALRGRLLWFVERPEEHGESAVRYVEDGLLVLAGGKILAAGETSVLRPQLPAAIVIHDHSDRLITPGFIDPHIHLPQTQVVASWAAQLLDWLNTYTFVEEQKYGDPAHAARGAAFFFDELLSNGTTTAVAFCSVHSASAEAFFAESERRNTRMAAGKVMMDRYAPDALTDTAQSGYDDSKALIGRWHGRGRQLYAIAPRFAITSTPAQLEAAATLSREHPDCLVETHISENLEEVATAKRLYPECADYTAIYEKYGLLGSKSLMGHSIHLSESERQRYADADAVAVFCPTSNLFLGSGLFDWKAMRDPNRPVRIGVATDIGGGTSYSMLQTMNEAYKVLQLQGQRLDSLALFHAMTRGNAIAIGLEHLIGSFEPGLECDAVVLDARATPAMAHRMETVTTLAEELFVLVTLGDDRAVEETYVMGEPKKPRKRG